MSGRGETSAAAEVCTRHGTKRWRGSARGRRDASTSAANETAASVLAASLRWRDQGRAGKQREPIEFSFHDFDFSFVLSFLNHLLAGSAKDLTIHISESRLIIFDFAKTVWH